MIKDNTVIEGGTVYELNPVHIDMLRAGDLVYHDGKVRTLGQNNIKRGGFMRRTIWGDSYMLGRKPVMLATKAHKEGAE